MEISVGDRSSAGLEALSLLRSAAQPSAGSLAGELAERALRVTERADFIVAQAALQALLRRLAAAPDAGAILSGPRRRGLGWYRVGRRSREATHHHVLLASVDPIDGSCSCPDFARASLGLCRHLFLVATANSATAHALERPPLRWDPVRPLTGPGDWLERLTWCDGPAALTAGESRVRRLFRANDGERLRLPPGVTADPRARLSAVQALLEVARARDRLAEPAVLPLLERERRELTRMARGGLTPREIRRHTESLQQKLLLYQREGVRRFLERGRLLLADDLGLGKTAQAIAACHVLVASGRARRGLIVVPAALKPHWQREWQRFTDLPLTVVEGRPDERGRTTGRAGPAILLMDHAQMARDLPRLLRFGPEIVVLDEAQRIRSWQSTATRLEQLDARWRLVLTGSPMEDRLVELASIMEWIDPSALEPRWRLASWRARWDGDRRAIAGARNLETLRQRLAPSVMRRARRDVIEQLPARRDICISTPLTAGQRAAHDDLAQPVARMVSRGARRLLGEAELRALMALLTRQRIACNGLAHAHFLEVWPSIARRAPTDALLESLATPKLGELRELVSAIALTQERKVVVFSQWRRMLRLAAWAVSDVLRAGGVRAVFFGGEESARQRARDVDAFHDDADVRVLFATDAAGAGLDLRRAASCCIHLDLPWNPAVLEQRTGRIHRVGQERPVDTWALVTEEGIEGGIATLLADERALLAEQFDGTSDTIELDRAGWFLERLQSVLPAPTGARELGDGIDIEGDAGGAAGDGTERGALDGAQDDSLPAVDPSTAGEAAPGVGAAGGVSSLIGQIEVRQLPDGRVSLEAPAPAAAALAELLEGVARLLAPAARPATGDG